MALVRCPDCGREISSEAPACIQCGRPMKDAPQIPTQATQAIRPRPGPPPVPKPILGMSPGVFAILLSAAFFVLLAAILGGVFSKSKAGYTPSQAELNKMAKLQREAVAEAAKKRAAEEEAAALKRQEEQAAEEAKFLKTRAGRIWQKHPDWPKDICEVIAQGKVRQGMTADQIRASWGKPDRIHRTVIGDHVSEQWVYDRGSQNQYLYLENGVMTTYSD